MTVGRFMFMFMFKRRPFQIESLERRDLMTAESLAWDDASSLRLSFVPDGTRVANQVSDLDKVLSASPAGSQWREAIAQAFQIWSQYANINVGIVSDSGTAIGAAGPVRADDRFGEIRVGGISMSPDTWAEAIDHEKLSSGTWAGDMFFNTDADWNKHPDDLLRVALHEAGHVLGLPHNSDPNSPMHTHGVPTSLVPAASDIALLQELYGLRGPDANEISKANDKLGDATRMRFSDVSSKFDGSKPLVHYGEIQGSTDRDIFYFETPGDYAGPTTINVVSKGLSLLKFRLTVMDDRGTVLQTADNTAALGGEASVHLQSTTRAARYYVQIDPLGDSLSKMGRYAVIAELDNRITIPHGQTLAAVSKADRWFASSPNSLGSFNVSDLAAAQKNVTLSDDKGTDDNPADATRIDPFMDSTVRRSARAIGTITSVTDVDSFRFRSPRPAGNKVFGMLVQVDAIERDGLLPSVVVLDSLNRVLQTEFLVNGNGEVKLWLPSVSPNADYIVQITGVAGNNIGNYEITSTFQETKPVRALVAESDLTPDAPESQSVWYVARPQLFTLALDSTHSDSSRIPVWVNVYDDRRRAVGNIASVTGLLRTGPSLLLMPGTYYLQFGTRFSSSAQASETVHVKLTGQSDTDPLGPPLLDPGTTPIFACPDNPDIFCYPPDVRTTEPFVILVDPDTLLPTTVDTTLTMPPDAWFNNNTVSRTNTVFPQDVNNSGFVSALDALLVINAINQFGTGLLPAPPVNIKGQVDINNDGLVTALDALLVINYINLHVGGEGESFATATDAGFSENNSSLWLAPEIVTVRKNALGVFAWQDIV